MADGINKTSNLIIISGPSGAGEDSIIEGLARLMPLERVVTTTTRAQRPGDSDGSPYYFISKKEFEHRIAEEKFFEHARHYNGNYYGVTFEEIERVKKSNRLGIWKIDYKGVLQAKKLIPGISAILITAPLDILEQRIRRRSQVTDAYVAERMAYTREWMKHIRMYDYVVENVEGKLPETIEKVRQIMRGLDENGLA